MHAARVGPRLRLNIAIFPLSLSMWSGAACSPVSGGSVMAACPSPTASPMTQRYVALLSDALTY